MGRAPDGAGGNAIEPASDRALHGWRLERRPGDVRHDGCREVSPNLRLSEERERSRQPDVEPAAYRWALRFAVGHSAAQLLADRLDLELHADLVAGTAASADDVAFPCAQLGHPDVVSI